MKKLKKFLQESLRIGINKYIPIMSESLRIGINDTPKSTSDDISEIYNILANNFSKGSDTIFFSGEFIDIENIIESMYECHFQCVGKPHTVDIKNAIHEYNSAGFSVQFEEGEYEKGVTSIELYNLKLADDNYISYIFNNLDCHIINTKDVNTTLNIYEDDEILLCGIVQKMNSEPSRIDEILLILK